MTVHVHALRGCAPAPLAHYLKALAVLRLVSEQADPTARAWWKDDVFYLATELDEDALLAFFCERYAPTPVLSPWNGGSGFYPGDNKTGVSALVSSSHPRFLAYRDALALVARHVGEWDEAPEKGTAKDDFIAWCFRSWPVGPLHWLSAAVAPAADGGGKFPALLGTGGNDGRLDFGNNYMQRLLEIIDPSTGTSTSDGRSWLESALLAKTRAGLLSDRAIGQFFPGAAGGANGTTGFDAKSLINPWDFVLMLEGAMVLRVSALRKLDSNELVQAAAPFALRAMVEGFASAAPGDDAARGEQWLPLWSRPAVHAEVEALFAEGRLTSGGAPAQNALEAARAVARLGTARGVTTFTRVGYLVRNGLSNLAVPLGTFRVAHNPRVRLLDEVDDWMTRLRRAAGGKTAPAAFERVIHELEGRALAVCQATATRDDWAALVEALGEAEDTLVTRGKATAEARLRPLPELSFDWFLAADDGSPEMRLALAIASQRAPARTKLGSIRAHCLPLEPGERFARFATGESGLRSDRRVVWTGRDLVSDLAAVAVRRAAEGHREEASGFPLVGAAFASLSDVRAFLEGRVDDGRIGRLARGFMSLDFSKVPSLARDDHRSRAAAIPLYAMTRLAYLPESIGVLSADYDALGLRLLESGRLADGARAIARKLSAKGLRPKLRVFGGDAAFARRLAASVAIPVSFSDLSYLLDVAVKPFDLYESDSQESA